MPLPGFIKNIFAGGAGELVKNIGEAADRIFTSKEEKAQFQLEMTKAVNDHVLAMEQEVTKRMESEDKAISDRWSADMASDSWMSKNARPLIMFILVGFLIFLIAIDSIDNVPFNVSESYVSLLEVLTTTVIVAYFGSRGVEKYKTIHEYKNLKR